MTDIAVILTYIAVMAGVTYVIRAIPLVLFRKKITNKFVISFLHYIPYAVLSAMTFPAIFSSTASPISAAIGLAVGAVIAYFERGLLTVAVSACAGVFITELAMSLMGCAL